MKKLTVAAVVIPLLLAGCGGTSTDDSSAEDDSSGTLVVNIKVSGGDTAIDYCPRQGDDTEMIAMLVGSAKRLKVRVIDIDDNVVANSFSDTSTLPSKGEDLDMEAMLALLEGGDGCTIVTEFEDIPRDLEFYTFQADINESNFSGAGADVASLTFSREEMEEANWQVDAVITGG